MGPNETALWRACVRLRAYDERAVALSRQGGIGAYPLFWGEEGVQAGAVAGVCATDWLFLSYRQNAVPILRGMPPEQAWLYFRGDPQAFFDPAKYCCAPQAVPLATQLPHAVGWAVSRRRQGHDDVAVGFFGDGATSEGDFHEALNLAGVTRAPVVFVCTNNGWAISTPFERQTAANSVADKALGYGMPAVRVDAFDAVAVRDAVQAAAARARTGEGPTLVEAVGYRIEGHATADDPSRYRSAVDADRARTREPVGALGDRLVAAGALTREEVERQLRDSHEEMKQAASRLRDTLAADQRYMIEHVLATAPASLERQRKAAER
ncbi:pyruvate dehydrogenase (acetyl-transferring) E1 component subunit alpha [soil metagenome]